MTNAPCFICSMRSTIQEMVRVRGERRVERDDVALLQQFVERDVVGSRLRARVVGQDPAAESPQPVHDRRADASGSDDPDGQVAQFFPAHVVAAGSRERRRGG